MQAGVSRRSADGSRRAAWRIGRGAGAAAGGRAQDRARRRRHPLLAEALASLDRALIEASEAEDRIAKAAEALAFDPGNLKVSRRGCSTSVG
jgi:DNA repair protein RecN (Recombination protein N)